MAAKIPTEILAKTCSSDAKTCGNGKACFLLKQDSFDLVAELDGLTPSCMIDHPIMLLAKKMGDLALERD